MLEPAPHVFDASLEVWPVSLAVWQAFLPLARFFGAVHPAEVFNLRPQEPDRWPMHGDCYRAVLALEEEFRFSTLGICHNATALLVNNTAQLCHTFQHKAKRVVICWVTGWQLLRDAIDGAGQLPYSEVNQGTTVSPGYS